MREGIVEMRRGLIKTLFFKGSDFRYSKSSRGANGWKYYEPYRFVLDRLANCNRSHAENFTVSLW